MKVLLVTSAAFLSLAMAACTSKPTGPEATGKPSSADMERAVQNQWANHGGFQNLTVSANPDTNEVTITGRVPSEADRVQAISDAKTALPGATIVDKIEVAPAAGASPPSAAEPQPGSQPVPKK
jgi:hypothetical protein